MIKDIFIKDTGPSPLMQKICNQIDEAFRPEREEYRSLIGKACQVRELVQSHRYTFQQACTALRITPDQLLWAFNWIALDNTSLAIKYDSNAHWMMKHETETWRWLKQLCGEQFE